MKRRDVLTMTAAVVSAGCSALSNNGDGNNTSTTRSETTAESSVTGTETRTGSTVEPTATNTGSTSQTVSETERAETRTQTPPTPTTSTATTSTPTTTTASTPATSTPTENGTSSTPIPIPDAPTDGRKGTPLTGEANVTFKNESSHVVVSGTIVGENGCQTAVLDSVRQTKSGLVITVATERASTANATCSLALVEIDYRFVVDVKHPPESVTVIHRGVTERQTITTDSTL